MLSPISADNVARSWWCVNSEKPVYETCCSICGSFPVPSLSRWPDVLKSLEQLQRKPCLSWQLNCFTHPQLVTLIYDGFIFAHVNLYISLYCRSASLPLSHLHPLIIKLDFSTCSDSHLLWWDVCISFSAKLRQSQHWKPCTENKGIYLLSLSTDNYPIFISLSVFSQPWWCQNFLYDRAWVCLY